ncbi:MAG TPA: MFS transporter [Beutenbergiaceae bacterium]|nr:MFS transporter [Beutenbergiaceae bacterium]
MPRETSSSSHLAATSRPHPLFAHRPAKNAPLVAAAVLLITLTLRVPTASVGPVVPAIGTETGYPPPVLALLTSVPLLCFLVAAPFVPALQARLGLRSLLLWALLIASAGTLVRSIPGPAPLAVGTVLLGLAVAIASVLAPAVIKRAGTAGRGWVTSLYTASLSLGPALATGLTVPIGQILGGGWRTALAFWAILPFLAAVCWVFLTPSARTDIHDRSQITGPSPAPGSVGLRHVLREPSAWAVTVYLALTSLLFYSLSAWLPAILENAGRSAAAAGGTAALTNLVAIPASFLAPWLVRRVRATWIPPFVAPLPFALGAALLALAPEYAVIAVAMMGIGQGASVGIAYSLVLSTTSSAGHATALSAMSQTVGVTLAALGPTGLAAVRVAAGAWAPALGLLAAIAAAQAVIGLLSSRGRSALPS